MLFDLKTIELLKNKVQSDGFIDLPAHGNSMFPFIQKGNLCRFISTNPSQLKKGDIILFHSITGQLIAHRFFYSKKEHDGTRYFILKGDTNLGFDQPITEQQILGVLTFIQKGDKKVYMKNFSASLWGWLILSVPILSGMLRRYINGKNQFQL